MVDVLSGLHLQPGCEKQRGKTKPGVAQDLKQVGASQETSYRSKPFESSKISSLLCSPGGEKFLLSLEELMVPCQVSLPC